MGQFYPSTKRSAASEASLARGNRVQEGIVVAKDASLESYLSPYSAMKELACPEWISATICGFLHTCGSHRIIMR
jgi:hypothetical protein